MKIAILNYATCNDDQEALQRANYELHSRSEPVHAAVCTEADLESVLANLQYNVSEEVIGTEHDSDEEIVPLIWSDSETTEGVYEGRDLVGEIRAVITVWLVEV